MPKITDKPLGVNLTIRLYKDELKAIDDFYEDWKALSLDQLELGAREALRRQLDETMQNWFKENLPFIERGSFKRAGVVRDAIIDYLDRYDFVKTLNEGNVYSARINAFKFSMDDIMEVREDLKERAKNEATEGKKYLYEVLEKLLHSHLADTHNSFALKDDFYKVTQRLFVDQHEIKKIKEGK